MPKPIKFFQDIQLNQNEVLNIVLHNSAAAPAAPKKGQIYTNTTDNIVYYWDGTEWIPVGMLVEGGEGLTATDVGNVRTLDINVDNATIEIDADTVRVKDLGIDTQHLANDAVTTIKITDKNITFAKIQDMSVMTVLGSITGGTPEEIAILDESDLDSDSATSLATQRSIKAYVDGRLSDIGVLIGGFDASAGGNLPGDSETVKGDYWYATSAGTVQGQKLNIGDVIIANQDEPSGSNANHYIFLETNRDQATTTILGMVKLATNAEVQAGTNSEKAITPAGLSSRTATETRTGIAEIATQAEVNSGTDDERIITPLKLKAWFEENSGGYVADIGDGTSLSFAITHGLNSKDLLTEVVENSTGETVKVNVARTSVSVVTVTFGASIVPTAAQFRILIKKVG